MLTGPAVEMPPRVVSLTQQQLVRYAGTYRTPTGGALTVTVNRGFLEVAGEGQEAFALAVDGEWLLAPTFDTLNARTVEVVEASRARRFDVVARFFGPPTTVQELEAFETAFWSKRHDALGEYVRTRVLGTMRPSSRRYSGRTIVAIDFSRGTTWREYFWTPQGYIGDVGPLDGPPTSQFLPVSQTCFVAFDPAQARSTQFCVESVGGTSAIRIAGSPVMLQLER